MTILKKRPIPPPFFEAPVVRDWVIEAGLKDADLATLLNGFCQQLVQGGLPLHRAFLGTRTLHPKYGGYGYWWRLGNENVEEDRFIRGMAQTREWLQSPFYHLLKSGRRRMRCRLEDAEGVPDFPVLNEFREQGLTDYLALIVGYGGSGEAHSDGSMIASWATDRPGGFTEAEVSALESLMPSLSLAVKAASIHHVARGLLETYLGTEPGRRVYHGEIDRGSVQSMEAAIIFADLRGFTRLADILPHGEIVPLLDDYFELMVDPIQAQGGEVLKFMGDGLIATFDLAEMGEADICRSVLDTAAIILGRVQEFNARRAAQNLATMPLDLAVHLGEVMFGNVGSSTRLDFTVVGRAVNEAARIEALCRVLERNILVSEAFARAAEFCTKRLRSLGSHALRGVGEPQELFTLASVEP